MSANLMVSEPDEIPAAGPEVDALADRIEQFVARLDGSVSQGTLLHHPEFAQDDLRGEHAMVIPDLNVVFLVGASQLLVGALAKLIREKRIQPRPCEMLVLLVDGALIPQKMPLAKRPPSGGYKRPHYLPVVFDPVG